MADGRRDGAVWARGVSVVLPGLPQLLRGRVGSGGILLTSWLLLGTVFVRGPGHVLAALTGSWDERVAGCTVLAGLIAAWTWSWVDLKRSHEASAVGMSQWGLATRAFSKNRMAVVGLILIVLLYLVALVTPLIAPHHPNEQYDLASMRLIGLSATHPLGTDQLARDVLSRILYGARISLSIGFVAVGISVTIGTFVGAIAGFFGGVVDSVIMRFVDMVISFPRLVLLIAIVAAFDRSFFLIIIVLGLTLWPSTARLVRAEVLSLREREFIQAARALGFSKRRILVGHLIPNAVPPVIVAATLGIGNTIVLEAGLSFLSLGVQAPTASWGSMIADGRAHMFNAWWLSTFPGLAIVFTVLAFNLVGDGLRDALDPRLRS